MIEVMRPVFNKVALSLSPIDCEVFRSLSGPYSLNKAKKDRAGTDNPLSYPYSHIEMVGEPESQYVWESLARFQFTAWGSQWQVSEIAKMIDWLDGHYEDGEGDGESLVYDRTSRSYRREPEPLLDSGGEVWRLDDRYLVSYRKATHFENLLGGAV